MNAGVSSDTIVQTINGPQAIGSLCEGDQVLCFGNNPEAEVKSVTSVESKMLDTVIEITTADDVVIRVAPEQKFFVTHKWVNAEDLSLNDVLITKNKTFVGIKSIRHLQEEETFCFIEVKDHHNFLATANGVLVHNGVIGAQVGCAVGASAVAGTYGAITAGIGFISGPAAPVVLPIWGLWTSGPALVATKIGGIAGGIWLGTVTGPV